MKSMVALPVLAVALSILPGCTSVTFSIDDPEPSDHRYQLDPGAPSKSIRISDQRTEEGKEFSRGRLDITLIGDEDEFELIGFLQEHLPAELSARGIDATVADTGDVLLEVQQAKMLNQRATGFSPYVTLTTFSANLTDGEESHRLGVFIRRAKVPVWSIQEVVEPTLNQPLELLVNEIAAKINARVFGRAISDEEVESLVTTIGATDDEDIAYQKVYQLGFGNNPAAIPHLIGFTEDVREYVRQAAISSLGILQATDQLDHLIAISKGNGNWADRAMALKALGDLGTPESLAYLGEIRDGFKGQTTNNAVWSTSIINLYLD